MQVRYGASESSGHSPDNQDESSYQGAISQLLAQVPWDARNNRSFYFFPV